MIELKGHEKKKQEYRVRVRTVRLIFLCGTSKLIDVMPPKPVDVK